MLNNNTIYYIESIKIKGKEISEENPIWIKCETWQWGSIMAGRGKTRISPEVGHFLHDFWVLAAFIANTLIFIVVGVIIAE